MKTHHAAVIAVITVITAQLLGPSPLSAQELAPQPAVSINYENLVALRVNPLGAVDFFDFTLRLRLYESDSKVLMQNYVGLGVAGGISPAWGRIGVQAIVQPLTILQFYARYWLTGYFSSFNLFASFPSADADFSDSTISDRADQPGTENYATMGGELTLGARVQLKVGPIAARNHFRGYYVSMDTERGDPVFYDQIHDMLMPNDGWIIINDLDVLWVSDFGLVVGPRWTYSHAFYRAEHYAGGVIPPDAPNNDIHRLGPLIAYVFDANPGGRIESPTVLLLAQWHLVHRWRTGQDVPTALPYIGLAFQMRGDLLSQH